MENKGLKNEEDMVALAEELAARVSARREAQLPPWAGYVLAALGGAGAMGLWIWFF